MSIERTTAEKTPELPGDRENDVTAERRDPKETYAEFERKHAAWKASPSDPTWHEFRRAYLDFKASVSKAVLDALWKQKRDSCLVALRDYGAEADHRRAKGPGRKKTKAKYDRRNALTERRKEQCREARQTYQERQRAKKKAAKEAKS